MDAAHGRACAAPADPHPCVLSSRAPEPGLIQLPRGPLATAPTWRTKSTGASASGRFGAVGPLVGIARPHEEVPVTARGFSTIRLCEAKLTAFPLRKNTSWQMTGVPKTHSLSGRMT